MHYSFYIIFFLFFLLGSMYAFFYVFLYKIKKFEKKIIQAFLSRSDSIPALYEISKENITRHSEIFADSLALRKKEFHLSEISENLEGFIELESHMHHEINFIFQVCNKNPKLLKNKNFLYVRDIFIDKSSHISKNIKIYNQIIILYNTMLRYKNYSLIGLVLPFTKKSAL